MSQRFVMTLVAIMVGGAIVWWTYGAMVAQPEQEVRAKLTSTQKSIESAERFNRSRVDVTESLRELRARTLGASSEEVEHNLRVLLGEIGRTQALAELVVDSRRRNVRENPAMRVATRTFRDKEERRSVDFVEVEGTLSGLGSVEQVLGTVATIQSQPWLKRVDLVRVTPRGDGSVVELTVSLRTAYIPGATGVMDPVALGEITQSQASLAVSLSGRSMFMPPPPPPPEPVQAVVEKPKPKPKPRPKPPAPKYDKWRITGWAQGRDSVVLYLVEVSKGTSRVLIPGDEVLNMVFRGLEGPSVVLELDGIKYYFGEGDTLDRRAESPH